MPYKFEKRSRGSAKWAYTLIIPDTHVGYVGDVPTYSPGAWDCTMRALHALRQQDRLTHLGFIGDFGNWESLSRWASLTAEQAYVEEDVALVNARLNEVQAILRGASVEEAAVLDYPVTEDEEESGDFHDERKADDEDGVHVFFCEGNHEAWASQLEAKYPGMRDSVNLYRRLRFYRRRWQWVPENHYYQLGDIHLTHGHVRGCSKPEDYLKLKGVSVMYGHTHAVALGRVNQLDRTLRAFNIGCLASIDPPPPYSRGEVPSRWAHAFGLIQVRRNGRFQVQIPEVEDETYTELPDGTEIVAKVSTIEARLKVDRGIRQRLRQRFRDRYYHPGGSKHGLGAPDGLEPVYTAGLRSNRTRVARTRRGLPGEIRRS